MFKVLFFVILAVFSLSVLNCSKPVEKVEPAAKIEEKPAVDCSMFIPPWKDEYWESWGKAHPAEFEAWYGEIIPKMSKITADDIKACSHLDNVFIGFSKLSSLEVFSGMKQLRKLDMRFSPSITDLTPLKDLENLEFLSVWKTAVTDLSPVADLPKLKIIDAKMTDISDISMLNRMKSLGSIDLLMTKVSDISIFKEITTIEEVLLCSTAVTDISVVYPLAEKITYLDLCNTKFSDFKALKKFKNLERLKLWGLPVKDASLFSEMENLYELDLWKTQITDLRPLYKLKKLKRLVVVDLKVDQKQLEQIKKNNPGIEIVEKL